MEPVEVTKLVGSSALRRRLQAAVARGLTLFVGRQRAVQAALALRQRIAVAPDGASAVAYYRQALTLAAELGMRPLQAHCHVGLGALYVKIGQRKQARTALSTAIDLYRAMEMTFWLLRVEAELAKVA